MWDLDTLKRINATQRKPNPATARTVCTVVAGSETLSLDRSRDRKVLVSRLVKALAVAALFLGCAEDPTGYPQLPVENVGPEVVVVEPPAPSCCDLWPDTDAIVLCAGDLLAHPLPAGACGVLVCPSGRINVCGPPLDGEGLGEGSAEPDSLLTLPTLSQYKTPTRVVKGAS